MSTHFKSKRAKASPAISTASLPDIIFILLFFFMVVTVIRDLTPMVLNRLPSATEIEPLEKKSTAVHLYIGTPVPRLVASLGSSDRVQLNDAFIDNDVVGARVLEEVRKMLPEEQAFAKVYIKEDIKSQVGILTEVKQQLRKVGLYSIVYATHPEKKEE
jgi:biopolymer transport protein ExbD